MYAVLSSGGKQYRVEPGTTLLVERVAGEPGASITFDRVLLVADGDDVTVGTPTVSGATISGTILREELGPKIVIFKYKQKIKYRRRTGHRQHLVRIRIDEISANGKSAKAEVARPEPKARPRTGKPQAEAAAEDAEVASATAKAKPKARARAKPAKPKPKAKAKAADGEAASSKAEEKPKAKPRAKPRAKAPKTDKE